MLCCIAITVWLDKLHFLPFSLSSVKVQSLNWKHYPGTSHGG